MKRKGFTLVELLIVIVVIGILSAMMMLSSTEAVSSAKASNIVSNLRNLKTAALAYYTDNMYDFSKEIDPKTPTMSEIWQYMNNSTNTSNNVPDAEKYTIKVSETGSTQGSWFLEYEITGTDSEVSQIKSKLKGRAKSVGLLKGSDSTSTVYNGDDKVYYFVR